MGEQLELDVSSSFKDTTQSQKEMLFKDWLLGMGVSINSDGQGWYYWEHNAKVMFCLWCMNMELKDEINSVIQERG